MRLVKINNVILNMDKITMIKGKESSDNVIKVYVYNSKGENFLGTCENEERFQAFIDELYEGLSATFPHDVVLNSDKELWS